MSEAKEEPKFKVDDEVEHRFEHSTEWHRGKIIAINGNTTCTIEYEKVALNFEHLTHKFIFNQLLLLFKKNLLTLKTNR